MQNLKQNGVKNTLEKIFLDEKTKGKKKVLLIDCEIFSPEFFHGVSNSNDEGFSKEEVISVMDCLNQNWRDLDAVLFSNFNPAVEKMRSSMYLMAFLRKLLA